MFKLSRSIVFTNACALRLLLGLLKTPSNVAQYIKTTKSELAVSV